MDIFWNQILVSKFSDYMSALNTVNAKSWPVEVLSES